MKYNLKQPGQPTYCVCGECGTEVSFKDNTTISCRADEKRYPALRSIISWYRFLAWLMIIGAAIVSLIAGFLFDVKQSVPFIMFTLFFGIIGFINFMALGEGVLVFLDIEENTRIKPNLK